MAEPELLVLGGTGQVGHELLRHPAAARYRIDAPVSSALDLTDGDAVARHLETRRPRAVINAAAYTAVDRAEEEPARAFAVNAAGAGAVARAAARLDIPLVHLSTDYVFDGSKAGAYAETDAPRPANVYGASKLDGEREVLAAAGAATVLRVSWVFGAHGGNFVKTMLRLAGERDELRVVDDQYGTPCSARAIAEVCLTLLDAPGAGVLHFRTEPVTTWFGFAAEIVSRAHRRGLIERAPRVTPITTAEFPTPARRPANSVLADTELRRRFTLPVYDWRHELDLVLEELRDEP